MAFRHICRALRPAAWLLPVLATLAACGEKAPPPQPLPPPPAPPAPPPPPPPPPAAPMLSWEEAQTDAGDWRYEAQGNGSIGRFGANGADRVRLRCDLANRRLILSIAGQSQAVSVPVTLRTTYGALAWFGTPVAGEGGWIEISRAASDQGFDWIAFSRGRIAIEAQGLPRMIVPVWGEVSRLVEDCRG